ncbi:winged helix-turn-helix domain-containing protein [Kibdelosporangium persicum]|uniref:Winged helix-turn-helix transcriptional regulator n=1 Tax=Kibdelosporangium persicum TaxID=2698649 RepID=A0ABX2F9T9_9PSEU|nr:winged helix-turn-helix domain-containing protein [Kibdelosporangium persicum]NRN68138.1 Winged helix-turn-helix transcriptional regulator [Kibdelosporangium persicum]
MPPPDHPIRAALLALLRERDTVTSTQAAQALGFSSGLCSFHLRQLARYGYVEEAATTDGRARPWRLAGQPDGPDLGLLARELEDEGYQRWLQHKDSAPADWSTDDAFSSVLFLEPGELAEVGAQIRAVLARYATREVSPAARPVAAVARLFPLLPVEQETTWPSES